jgi:hypothetical protein
VEEVILHLVEIAFSSALPKWNEGKWSNPYSSASLVSVEVVFLEGVWNCVVSSVEGIQKESVED